MDASGFHRKTFSGCASTYNLNGGTERESNSIAVNSTPAFANQNTDAIGMHLLPGVSLHQQHRSLPFDNEDFYHFDYNRGIDDEGIHRDRNLGDFAEQLPNNGMDYMGNNSRPGSYRLYGGGMELSDSGINSRSSGFAQLGNDGYNRRYDPIYPLRSTRQDNGLLSAPPLFHEMDMPIQGNRLSSAYIGGNSFADRQNASHNRMYSSPSFPNMPDSYRSNLFRRMDVSETHQRHYSEIPQSIAANAGMEQIAERGENMPSRSLTPIESTSSSKLLSGEEIMEPKELKPNETHAKKLPYPCRDFKNGQCTRGENCKFLHVAEEQSSRDMMKHKMSPLCRDFQRGQCLRKNCKFLHITPEELAKQNSNLAMYNDMNMSYMTNANSYDYYNKSPYHFHGLNNMDTMNSFPMDTYAPYQSFYPPVSTPSFLPDNIDEDEVSSQSSQHSYVEKSVWKEENAKEKVSVFAYLHLLAANPIISIDNEYGVCWPHHFIISMEVTDRIDKPKKKQSYQNQIRSLQRVCKKNADNKEKVKEIEGRIKELEILSYVTTHKEEMKKNRKFSMNNRKLELGKAAERVKKAKSALANSELSEEKRKELELEVSKYENDIIYIKYFPDSEKYVPLYTTKNVTEQSKEVQKNVMKYTSEIVSVMRETEQKQLEEDVGYRKNCLKKFLHALQEIKEQKVVVKQDDMEGKEEEQHINDEFFMEE